MQQGFKMRNFRDYVLLRDHDHSLALDGRHPEDTRRSDEADALLYQACKMFIRKKPEALMGFLEDQGDDEVRNVIMKIKNSKGGLNLGKGLGNIGGDDLEKFKTPEADRAGSPEEGGEGGSGAGY